MHLKTWLNAVYFPFIFCCFFYPVAGQTDPCQVVQVQPNPNPPVFWSPDSSKYFLNLQDSAGIFQIYVGNAGDPVPICVSNTYTNGNCCGLFRSWDLRNKLQVQWHASGNYLICAVEKEFYNELLFVPYSIRLGWLQSGLWMDIWALRPDGSHWFNLVNTVHGFTGPAFTPDGKTCVWAEAQDSSNLAVDVFGIWKLLRAGFVINNDGVPVLSNITDISPAGSRWNEPGNFAPDGVSVLISSDIGISNAEGQDQFILNIHNGQISNLTNSPMIWDEHGIFSPDGKKVLFMSSYPYRADTNSYHTLSIKTEFMLINTDGTGLQQLTHYREPGYPESHEGIAATGFWTPNGARIYAQSLIFPDYRNWIIDFEGHCGNTLNGTNDPELTLECSVFPNPAQDFLFVRVAGGFQPTQLQLLHLLGQTVSPAVFINGDTFDFPLGGLDPGFYYLQVKSGAQSIMKPFIKQE